MKNLLLLLICIPFFGIAQTTDYELEFNSATLDYVEMLNTSAVIANKTSFSISGWVNPQSNTNHGGIMGFRNNIDADFYLLQLQNTNNIEARFRNSLGVDYDIVAFNALDFNQWQHLAFTYNGSYIRLYKDGIFLDSTAANGTIIQTAQSFRLGSLNYQGLEFYLIGRLDEVRLWDVALSQIEINNWMCSEIDTSHPNYTNLMGYWNLNEGIGSYTYDQTSNGNNGTLFGGTTWQASSSCLTGAVLCGDVNEDGIVDQTDVTEINNFILGSPPLVFNPWAADVNCDGTINILDITMLNSFISGTGSLNCCSTTPPLTYVPDDNFETYLENNGMGDGIALNDYVYTSAIDTATILSVSNQSISDLTGIEDFTSLTYLDCNTNPLTNLDVSNNTALTSLDCESNQLTSLDVSQNTALTQLWCQANQLTTLDVSQNTALTHLNCPGNQLTSLDVSQNTALTDLSCFVNNLISLDVSNNTALTWLWCQNNPLTFLDIRNGNNTNFSSFNALINPYLTCINVDDSVWSAANWTNIDPQHYFSNNCSGTAIEEQTTNKELLLIIDVLGRETEGKKKEPLFYIYDDGTVKKKIIVE